MNTYRFFLSYRREEQRFAQQVSKFLQSAGHEAITDINLPTGKDFWQEIQKSIQRVHFFIPVLTPITWESVSVQQEIGYALASNVPVLPIVIGKVPKRLGMITQVQAVVISPKNRCKELKSKLGNKNLEILLRQAQERLTAVFRCDGDDRVKANLIAESANELLANSQSGKIMQRSTLTSFSLPMRMHDQYWQGIKDRNDFFWFVLDERKALQEFADREGCDLIIDPCYAQPGYRVDIQCAKLYTLRKFLRRNVDNDKFRVIVDRFERSESEIIIGNHWMAHSAAVATMETERETISTWHAPTIWRCYKGFQDEFQTIFKQQKKIRKNKSSARYAIEIINCRLRMLKENHLASERRCEACKYKRV